MKVVGRVVRTGATLITVKEVGAKENVLIYGRGNGDLEVENIYEFSHLLDGEKMFKSFRTTEKTKVLPTLSTNGSDAHTSSQIFKQTEMTVKSPFKIERINCNLKVSTTPKKTSPFATCSTKQTESIKRMTSSAMLPEKWKQLRRDQPKGKTYRKTKYDPSIVSMQDPKVRKKLDNMHRRDTKSGGLSSSSRLRRDPNTIRLGSERFSKPRSDRIHSVDFDDDGPRYDEI